VTEFSKSRASKSKATGKARRRQQQQQHTALGYYRIYQMVFTNHQSGAASNRKKSLALKGRLYKLAAWFV